MYISRRRFFAVAGGSALVSYGSASDAWPVLTSLPFGQDPRKTSPFVTTSTTTEDSTFSLYNSTLISGFTPKYPAWFGQKWTAAMGATWYPNMPHSWRVTTNKSRFELHNTVDDRGQNDPSTKRRTELHDKKHLLTNGISYWGAYSSIDHSWSDPVGMQSTTGGAHFQMHMPAGGSPAFAFRRDKYGNFLITTNGDNDPINNHARYNGPLSFAQVHDIVYRCVIHPTNGELDVWLDRKLILSLRNISLGTSTSGCYPCYGLYYADGCTCNIVAEHANIAFPSTTSLTGRTTSSPSWPSS